jgi:hypothetical protein
MFTFLSSGGLKHYFTLKHKIEVQEKEILELESDVISLQKYKQELENGDYILDNALKLGYINEGDVVHFYDYKDETKSLINTQSNKNNTSADIKVTKNKSNSFFLLISALIGLVLTLTFSVISKKR